MTSRQVGRGSGRPGAGPGPGSHRQGKAALRPRHVAVLGALAMAASSLLFLSGPISTTPDDSAELLLQTSRRFLETRAQASSAGRRSTLADDSLDAATQLRSEGGAPETASSSGRADDSSSGAAPAGGSGKSQAEGAQMPVGDLGRDSFPSGKIQEIGGVGGEVPAKSPEELMYERMPIRQLPIPHEMDDEELLWRASFISLRDPNRRLGHRKIAFLFTFTGQLFFAHLWARFFSHHEERFSVYLHGVESNIDKSTLPAVFHHRFVPVEPASTGTGEPYPHMSAVDSVRRLIANALLDMSNEWFILVCDLCIPLHDFDYYYEYFSSSPTRNYVPHQTPPWHNGLDRLIASCFEPLVTPEQWRKGGPWLGLTRRMALALVSDIKFYDKFATCCLPIKRGGSEPCFPLEHYLATVLPILGTVGSNYLQPEEVTNWSTVFEDWWTDPQAGRPFVYNASMMSEKLIKTMRRCHLGNLCHLQGAHFDPATVPLLLNMSTLLGY